MEEMPRSSVVLTHHNCLSDFVPSPLRIRFPCSCLTEILAEQVSWVSEKWFVSSDVKDIICRWNAFSLLFFLRRNVIFKCDWYDLEKKMILMFICTEEQNFSESEYFDTLLGATSNNGSDWLLPRLSRYFTTCFLNISEILVLGDMGAGILMSNNGIIVCVA